MVVRTMMLALSGDAACNGRAVGGGGGGGGVLSLCWRRRFIPLLEWWKANSGMHKSGAGGRTDCRRQAQARPCGSEERKSKPHLRPSAAVRLPKVPSPANLDRYPLPSPSALRRVRLLPRPAPPPTSSPPAAFFGQSHRSASPPAAAVLGSASAHCVALPPSRYGQSLRATVPSWNPSLPSSRYTAFRLPLRLLPPEYTHPFLLLHRYGALLLHATPPACSAPKIA